MLFKMAPTALMILLFNLVPVIGVAFYNWSPFEMFWLFWVETLIIAIFNAIRILFSQGNFLKDTGVNAKLHFQIGSSFKYLIARILIFLFYSLFIIVFIGFLSEDKNEPLHVAKTLAMKNFLFNMAIILSICTQAYYLLRYFFMNKVYLYSKTSDYSFLFDGRQIVIHVGVVLGAVGATFLFKGSNQLYASIWIISIFCLVKCLFEFYTLKKEKNMNMSALSVNGQNM